MAKTKLSTGEQIEQLITTLQPTERDFVNYIRQMVLAISPQISEQVKWNSISFYFNGEMKSFDPKTYQRDLLVCNIHRGRFLLVFPTGAKVKDELNGKDYPDGRKIIMIESIEDAKQKTNSLKKIIEDWMKQLN